MKLIDLHVYFNKTHDVDYFGIELKNIQAGWLAVDECGDLRWHGDHPVAEPMMRINHGFWDHDGERSYIGTVDLQGRDWQTTLMEVA